MIRASCVISPQPAVPGQAVFKVCRKRRHSTACPLLRPWGPTGSAVPTAGNHSDRSPVPPAAGAALCCSPPGRMSSDAVPGRMGEGFARSALAGRRGPRLSTGRFCRVRIRPTSRHLHERRLLETRAVGDQRSSASVWRFALRYVLDAWLDLRNFSNERPVRSGSCPAVGS